MQSETGETLKDTTTPKQGRNDPAFFIAMKIATLTDRTLPGKGSPTALTLQFYADGVYDRFDLEEGVADAEQTSWLQEEIAAGCLFFVTNYRSAYRLEKLLDEMEIAGSFQYVLISSFLDVCKKLRIHPGVSSIGNGDAAQQLHLLIVHCINELPVNYQKPLEGKAPPVPPVLLRQIKEELPARTGVYYFLNGVGRPIYIGKAQNLQSRVLSHFKKVEDPVRSIRLCHEVKNIRYVETGSYLIAGLLEDREIRRYWPALNKAQKSNKDYYAVVSYENHHGTAQLALARTRKLNGTITHFHRYDAAKAFITSVLEKFAASNKENTHLPEAIRKTYADNRQCEIYLVPGRTANEHGFILFMNHAYKGFGYVEVQNISKRAPGKTFLQALQLSESSVTIEKMLESTRASAPDYVFTVPTNNIPTAAPPEYSRAMVLGFG